MAAEERLGSSNRHAFTDREFHGSSEAETALKAGNDRGTVIGVENAYADVFPRSA